jgi:hypothetical protein
MTTCLPYRCGSSARVRGLMIMLACCALIAGFPAASFGQATSSWVYYDSDGKLRYGTDAAGNRIIDYSWAGYRGGGVALPRVPARVTVNPSGGDDTAAIQSAIDTVSALQPDRGASAGLCSSPRGRSTSQRRCI